MVGWWLGCGRQAKFRRRPRAGEGERLGRMCRMEVEGEEEEEEEKDDDCRENERVR